jgi:hypothetical protein
MKTKADADEMREEYDFAAMAGGVCGKYVDRYRQGDHMVRLEADVAAVFPTDAAVNEALRSLMRIARTQATAK